MIRDQRRGYQGLTASSPDQVVRHWLTVLSRQDPPRATRQADHPVTAYVNASRWVADCDCGGGMLCWVENPYACCLDCGAVYPVEWPAEADEIVQLLEQRPDENTRNWRPSELVADLRAENKRRL